MEIDFYNLHPLVYHIFSENYSLLKYYFYLILFKITLLFDKVKWSFCFKLNLATVFSQHPYRK